MSPLDELPSFKLAPELSGLQLLEQWIAHGYVSGLNGTLKVRPVEARAGFVRFHCAIGPEHSNFVGLVHGGATAALVDIAGGAAAMSLLNPGETLLTVDLNARYISSITIGTQSVFAEATVTYSDARRIICEVKIVAENADAVLGSVSISRRPSAASCHLRVAKE